VTVGAETTPHKQLGDSRDPFPAPDRYNIPTKKTGVIRGVGHSLLLKYT